ncbi:MAG: hypothetical protein H8D81_01900 [Deltaproteobacteria bacterium]|nr:hypothetical protein [Deltaproteobacteria bacterium]
MGGQKHDLPSDLKAARTRFEKWRTTRSGRSRIPDALWDLAVQVVQTHGVYRVAKALRLDYQGLKRHAAAARPSCAQKESSSPFVELDLSGSFFPTTECVLELEEGDGSKMTIRLKGTSSVDVIGLSKTFFGRGR